MKRWIAVLACAGLNGCLVDLYGGNPRVQFKNTSVFAVKEFGIGDPEEPTWRHGMEPILRPTKTSAVIDLPVSGELRLWVRVADSAAGWDTLLTGNRRMEIGGFQLLEVSGEQRSKLSSPF